MVVYVIKNVRNQTRLPYFVMLLKITKNRKSSSQISHFQLRHSAEQVFKYVHFCCYFRTKFIMKEKE